MNKLNINVWNIEGYIGNEVSHEKKNNFKTSLAVDNSFSKDDVLFMISNKLSKQYRIIDLHVELSTSKILCLEAEWIEDKEYYADEYSECNIRTVYRCSHCGYTTRYKSGTCYCGARMKERANNISNQQFYEQYCKMCGTQRCMGIDDKIMREGCVHYREEILHEH